MEARLQKKAEITKISNERMDSMMDVREIIIKAIMRLLKF
jgi:hypothetical protein